MVSGLQFGTYGVPFPVGARNFSLFQILQTVSGSHPVPYSIGTVLFSGVKWSGCEFEYSPPSRPEVMNV